MSDILKTELDGPVAIATLHRPDKLNALNRALLVELTAYVTQLAEQPPAGRPRCLIVTGSGDKAFVAGADVAELAGLRANEAKALSELGHRLGRALEEASFPVIAAVNGFALGGGCELAMACDMIVAADDAVFGQPEIRIGVIPGAGGTQRLTRALGKAKAMEIILTGRNLPAPEAAEHGLITRLTTREQTLPEALRLAAEIAALPPLAVQAAKESVNRAFELSLEAGLEFERRNFFLLFSSEDQKEGMRAFAEKRAPEWKGR